MNSQEDIFATQTTKKIKYDFLVLCNKEETILHPFSIFAREDFSNREINDRWLESILDHSSRLKTLSTLGVNRTLSLFGKIDEGT